MSYLLHLFVALPKPSSPSNCISTKFWAEATNSIAGSASQLIASASTATTVPVIEPHGANDSNG